MLRPLIPLLLLDATVLQFRAKGQPSLRKSQSQNAVAIYDTSNLNYDAVFDLWAGRDSRYQLILGAPITGTQPRPSPAFLADVNDSQKNSNGSGKTFIQKNWPYLVMRFALLAIIIQGGICG
ncbi:hypothetical protein M422DRAFT_247519 [Sphaerobolus stellatus SS14]|nr:hypothetical protein M422DRAFT_247519 [Sphaerobolus stellatus SS14]